MMVANCKHSLLPLTMLRTVPGEGPGVSFSPLPLAGEGQGGRAYRGPGLVPKLPRRDLVPKLLLGNTPSRSSASQSRWVACRHDAQRRVGMFVLVPKLLLGNTPSRSSASQSQGRLSIAHTPGTKRSFAELRSEAELRNEARRRMFPAVVSALALLAFALGPASAPAGTPAAADIVRQGLSRYQAKDFKAAAAAFTEADVAKPDDPRITYDRAVALEAQGDVDKAREFYQKAAVSSDQELVVRCRYNLGCLAAAKARSRFGEHPENAAPEVRQEGLGLLDEAVGHYRDCLRIEPEQADARHNLALIRLWIKHMQALWEERDRQKEREETDLLAFLKIIQQRQRELRLATKALAAQPDSPQRRQAVGAAETAQRKLTDEIQPLKDKIQQALAKTAPPGAAAAGQPATAAPSPDAQKAVAMLHGLADDAGKAMRTAADHLQGASFATAVTPQEQAIDRLNEIFMAVAAFGQLLSESIDGQQGLLADEAQAGLVQDKSLLEKGLDKLAAIFGKKAAAAPPTAAQQAYDFPEASRNQGFVTGWVKLLAPKAEQQLKGLQSAPAAADDSGVAAPTAAQQQPPTAAEREEAKKRAEEARKQREDLQRALRKAVESGPKIEELSAHAAKDLGEKKAADAVVGQQEALRLLREIADLMPKQKQQQQDQKQGQQGKNQQDQKKNSPEQSQQQQQQKQQRQQDLSKQEAESLMRQVRDRQHQRQQVEKQFEQYRSRPEAVEKDW